MPDRTPALLHDDHLARFLTDLPTIGIVTVAPFDGQATPISDESRHALEALHASAGLELGGEPPPLDIASAEWAASQLYLACQCLVCRDVTPDLMHAAFSSPVQKSDSTAGIAWSVDVVFRWLPDLHAMLRRIAPDDPLAAIIGRLAQAWPLSSVGISLETTPVIDGWCSHPALWRLYVDRVSERQAEDRLRDPRVARQIRIDVGANTDLAPALMAALARIDSSTSTTTPHD